MSELGLASVTIVTRAESERMKVGDGAITVVPIWRFLLDLPDTRE
jgi:predicted AAA+ superfamily ATPase